NDLAHLRLGTWRGRPVRIARLVDALRVNGTRGTFQMDGRFDATSIPMIKAAVDEATNFDPELLRINTTKVETAVALKKTFPYAEIFVKRYETPTNFDRGIIERAAKAGLDGIMTEVPESHPPFHAFSDYVHSLGMKVVTFVHYRPHTLDSLTNLVNSKADY